MFTFQLSPPLAQPRPSIVQTSSIPTHEFVSLNINLTLFCSCNKLHSIHMENMDVQKIKLPNIVWTRGGCQDHGSIFEISFWFSKTCCNFFWWICIHVFFQMPVFKWINYLSSDFFCKIHAYLQNIVDIITLLHKESSWFIDGLSDWFIDQPSRFVMCSRFFQVETSRNFTNLQCKMIQHYTTFICMHFFIFRQEIT